MATAPRKGVVPDIEAGLPSPSPSPRSESPKPSPKPVTPPSDPLFKENTVYGLTGKGGRKRTRKHKKHARKTKKHLRRK